MTEIDQMNSETSPGLGERLGAVEATLGELTANIRELSQHLVIVQSSLQRLSEKVTTAAETLSAPRIRDLFNRLLLIYDLIEPAPANLPADQHPFYRMLAEQIEQLLAVNGLERIAADGMRFDPAIHKPFAFVEQDDPDLADRVVETTRHGFRNERAVLRPAEVRIARFTRITESGPGGACAGGQEAASAPPETGAQESTT
jgi:molecular chaperone GrpE